MDSGITEESKQVIKALHSQGDLDSDSSFERERVAEKIDRADTERVFDILGASETEDIAISYLQSEGWRIIKSNTSNSQAEIECEMRKEEDDTSPGPLPPWLVLAHGLHNPLGDRKIAWRTRMAYRVRVEVDPPESGLERERHVREPASHHSIEGAKILGENAKLIKRNSRSGSRSSGGTQSTCLPAIRPTPRRKTRSRTTVSRGTTR